MEGPCKKASFDRGREPKLRARSYDTFYDPSTDSLFVDMRDADEGLSYIAYINEHLAARLGPDGHVLGFILRSITVLAQRCELSIATHSKRVAVAAKHMPWRVERRQENVPPPEFPDDLSGL